MPGESDYVDSRGYLFLAAGVENDMRCAVIGVRKDYMTKFKFELDTVERHCVNGRPTTCGGTMFIRNFYLPPTKSKHVSMMDIERLAEVDDTSTSLGYFNWVGTQAMQRILQGDQETDDINEAGNKNRRDEEIWGVGRREAEPLLREVVQHERQGTRWRSWGREADLTTS